MPDSWKEEQPRLADLWFAHSRPVAVAVAVAVAAAAAVLQQHPPLQKGYHLYHHHPSL